ncbi:TRAP transporter substrate-binding protein [Ramlibacter sp. PS3R-8]|uniref:TRAP transporter substrate-binding protein n=1 Tax=Ramlibacter sp. PS3R-8 TaxID=3133437 RepID=UPI0030A1BD0C
MTFRRLALFAALATACAAASAQDIQERVIRFGHVNPLNHHLSLGVQKFAEIVAAKSGGKLKVQEFHSSSLGGEGQQFSAVQGGAQDMTVLSATVTGGAIKEFTLLDIPFSFTRGEQVDALVQGPFGQALLQRLPEKGLVGLGFWEAGFRQFTNSRKPIQTVDDLKGLKLRVIPNPMFVESFAALGANPVPMAFPELYGALESKAMDAQENPFAIILNSKFYEVQKFLSVTNHVYTASPVLVSKRLWDRMSATEHKILQDAAVEAGAYQRRLSRESSVAARKELEGKIAINDVPAATLARMRELTAPVAEKFASTYDPAVVKLYRAELEKVRATVR